MPLTHAERQHRYIEKRQGLHERKMLKERGRAIRKKNADETKKERGRKRQQTTQTVKQTPINRCQVLGRL